MRQCLTDGLEDHLVDLFSIAEPQLHLGWMHIHVQILRLNADMKQHKRILMLHHKRLVRVLNGLTDQPAFHIPSVDVIILKAPVASGDHRFSCKSMDLQNLLLTFHRKQIGSDLPSKHGVNNVL